MSKHKQRANRICEPGKGIRCHCGWISERRSHKEITLKLLSQPFYYRQWYQCTNPDCNTKTFMKDEDKVMNKKDRFVSYQNIEKFHGQTSFFDSK